MTERRRVKAVKRRKAIVKFGNVRANRKGKSGKWKFPRLMRANLK